MFVGEMSQAWTLVIISTLFLIGTTIIFLPLGYTILMLWICKKTFSLHHFLYNYVHPWNESNLDTAKNLYSFCYSALQSCSPHWHTRYWCFGFARKAFISTIFLEINIHLWNETNTDALIISILFVFGHAIMFTLLGYMILMHWICKKSFSFCHFP